MDQLNWKDVVRVGMLVATLGTMWWQLDNKIAREIYALDKRLTGRIDALDRKIDQLNILLTENLIALNRDLGELKGKSHTHDARGSAL